MGEPHRQNPTHHASIPPTNILNHDGVEPGYGAVFFDLDGTLLPMDIDEFLERYYGKLAEFVAAQGYDAQVFIKALNSAVKAMITHEDWRPNDQVFWESFLQGVDQNAFDWKAKLTEFYETQFNGIGNDVKPNSFAVQAVKTLKEKGYPLVLTTMPLFPLLAVEMRIRWAGLDPKDFQRITHYENSTSAKPKFAYYGENLAAGEVPGVDVLMVGNNTVEDTAVEQLGSEVYLITDHLLDPTGGGVQPWRHGTMKDFAGWVQTLPPCQELPRTFNPGLVPVEARDVALLLNGGFSPAVAEEMGRIAEAVGASTAGDTDK